MDESSSKLFNSGINLSNAEVAPQPKLNSSALMLSPKTLKTENEQSPVAVGIPNSLQMTTIPVQVTNPNGIPVGKTPEAIQAVGNEENVQNQIEVKVKATPTWQGVPTTIKTQIFGQLNATERSVSQGSFIVSCYFFFRCFVRLMTPFDKMLLKNSGFIFTQIDIVFNANEFEVIILEGTGQLYELKKKDRLVQLMAILRNPETQILTMNVYSDEKLGDRFKQMLKAMVDFNIPKNSINIQDLRFVEKVNSNEYYITTFLKYADPRKLQHLKLEVYMFQDQYLVMSRTPQWKSVDRLELHSVGILPYKPFFENWTGNCLEMELSQPYPLPELSDLFDEFKKKETETAYHMYSDTKFIIGWGDKYLHKRVKDILLDSPTSPKELLEMRLGQSYHNFLRWFFTENGIPF
ncbi:hypothetical protein CRE_17043 [Caenorhabditis remanei]|uniref:DUF38 domain-containing protein n=1 Tax=Caenorhabditis remanei TaxID=31234 RepID=E3M9V4_CAERE|nr:hypothetical protein CRE_17043 [Caenorhabditis remanei]